MKSWKTTVCGVIAAACAGIATAADMDPAIVKVAGVIGSIAVGAMGFFSRDNNVTSEAAGAKKP